MGIVLNFGPQQGLTTVGPVAAVLELLQAVTLEFGERCPVVAKPHNEQVHT